MNFDVQHRARRQFRINVIRELDEFDRENRRKLII